MAYPAGAIAFMRRNNLVGNILGDFSWGEYLIWHMDARSRVFLDSRFDMVYPARVFTDYITFYYNLPGAEKVLTAYPHDLVLIPPTAPASALMAHSLDWVLLYCDQNAMLFARLNSLGAQVRVIPDRCTTPAFQYFP
jgi:hypothetical protein